MRASCLILYLGAATPRAGPDAGHMCMRGNRNKRVPEAHFVLIGIAFNSIIISYYVYYTLRLRYSFPAVYNIIIF